MKNKSRILTVFVLCLFMTTMVPMMLTSSIVRAGPPDPTIFTNPAYNIGFTTAMLNGTVFDEGLSNMTLEGFRYGYTTAYGNYTNDTTPDTLDTSYIYAGGDYTGGTVWLIRKYWTSNMTLALTQALSNLHYITWLRADKEFIYEGSSGSSTIRKAWLSNLTYQVNTTANVGTRYSIDDKYIYTNLGYILYKNNLSLMYYPRSGFTNPNKYIFSFHAFPHTNSFDTILNDDNYVYTSYLNCINQFYKGNWTLKQNITTGSGVRYTSRDNVYFYACVNEAPGAFNAKINQYWLVNMTLKQSSAQLTNNAVTFGGITNNATYVYASLSNNTVNQYWTSNMTLKQRISLSGSIYECGMVCDDTYLYVGNSSGHTVNQYWESNMTIKESVNYGNSVFSLCIAPKYDAPEDFHARAFGLTPGQRYHFQAYGNNTNSTSTGADATFVTRPYPPPEPYFILRRIYGFGVNITWSKGLGANNTVIRVSNTGYPTSPTSGSPVYNGTALTYNHSIASPVIYWYYSAWSYSHWDKDHEYSSNVTHGMIIMWENPVFLEGPVSQPSLSRLNIVMQLTNLSYDTYAYIGYEYGTTAGLGSTSPLTNVSSTGTYTMTGNRFSPDTTYYLRMFATNHNGTRYGTLFTFHTSADSANYLVFNVLPIVIAVAIIGLIVLVALTGNLLTKEGLIAILTISILGIIVIQIITSL